MYKRQWFTTIVLSVILVLPLLLLFFHHNTAQKATAPPKVTQPEKPPQNQGNPPKSNPQPNPQPNPKPPQTVWGVDSASNADQAFLKCVTDHFGKPEVFGRYLETKDNISVGVTKEEAAFLHQQGIKILPIFNHFTNATSYNNGASEAKEAITYAQKLSIPKGKAIFADIEPKYPVDDGFIRGWADTLVTAGYIPGIYGVFTSNNEVVSAYKTAAAQNDNVKTHTIVWSSNPQPGITKKDSPPPYNPSAPGNMKVSIWQYGMDAKTCNIDTDLIQGEVLRFLW